MPRARPRWSTRCGPTASSGSRAPSTGTGSSSSTRTWPRRSRKPAAVRAARWAADRTAGTSRSTRNSCAASSTSRRIRGSPRWPNGCSDRLRDRRGRLRHPVPGRGQPAVASGFPEPRRHLRAPPLTSLAVNVTTVDTEPDMGPFEIAPGTQYDRAEGFEHEMFPPDRRTRATRSGPCASTRNAVTSPSARRSPSTAGTKNLSQKKRPVLVLGLDAPGAGNAEHHDLAVTADYWRHCPMQVRDAPALPGGGRADAHHPEAHDRGPGDGRGLIAGTSARRTADRSGSFGGERHSG